MTTEVDAVSRWGWSLRRHRLLLLVSVLVGLGVAAIGAGSPGPTAYRAEALVVARTLGIDPAQLPRLARAVHEAGSVPRRAVELLGDPYDVETVRRQVELRPFEENVAVLVAAEAATPDESVRVANAAARALVADLNSLGPGVGVFTLHAEAVAAERADPLLGVPVLLVVGAIAGALLGIGLVGSVTAITRPVLTGSEAAAAADAPLLGTLLLRPRAVPADLEEAPGAVALVRRLLPERTGAVMVLGVDGSDTVRQRVATVLVRAIAETGPVRFVATEGIDDVSWLGDDHNVTVSSSLLGVASRPYQPLVVDGPANRRDVARLVAGDALIVLVVPAGTGSVAVERASGPYLPGGLVGVVFVRGEDGRGRRRGA